MIAILGLLLAGAAVAVGGLALAWVLFPGSSGEWVALAVPAAAFGCLPPGILALLLTRNTAPSPLRTATRATAVLALFLPAAVWLARRF